MLSFSVFGWLRRAAAQAVVDGVRDGLVAVADDENGTPAADLGELRARIAAAVQPKAIAAGVPAPAPEPDEPAKSKRK